MHYAFIAIYLEKEKLTLILSVEAFTTLVPSSSSSPHNSAAYIVLLPPLLHFCLTGINTYYRHTHPYIRFVRYPCIVLLAFLKKEKHIAFIAIHSSLRWEGARGGRDSNRYRDMWRKWNGGCLVVSCRWIDVVYPTSKGKQSLQSQIFCKCL